ncbi:unnamed protein product [Dibothriocephalus latus]|uniref:Uncharacterized protein n=1 Tax=Dibothriocephalus latus TaxID=60516 RepID=A0A3P6TSE9_DIBLA|nr:unnamed protein product [Dibothriocephalus latus]
MAVKLRSPLARMIYEKYEHAQEHMHSNHEYWYNVRNEYLSPELMKIFVQSEQDEETTNFLEGCYEKSDWFFTQLYHSISKSILTWLLNRGSMFVVSTAQFRRAGDGKVTAKMAPLFDEVYATEMSPVMQWRLKQANFTVLDVEKWDQLPETGDTSSSLPTQPQYDVISCLNLLDRCSTPLTLLRRIRNVLRPGSGLLVLALVFPLKQYVEYSHKPLEMMEVSASRVWEVQFSSFVTNILHPAGYDLLAWSRVPYICEGDLARSFYSLNDVVMTLKPRAPDVNEAPSGMQ